jgi:hypothetical protein
MEDKDEYTATSSELHSKLKVVAAQLGVDVDKDKAWPKSARWLWRRIKEVLPVLVAAGIEATYERPESGTRIALRKVPKSNATNASTDEPRSDNEKAAGISAILNASSNASDGSNASENPAEEAASDNTGNRNGSFWEKMTPCVLTDKKVRRESAGECMDFGVGHRGLLRPHKRDCRGYECAR